MYVTHDIEAMRNALQDSVGPVIYERGLEYYTHERVHSWSVAEASDGSCTASGEVRGGEEYHVKATYYPENGGLWGMQCDCPYMYECKHGVALALAYLDSLEVPLDTNATEHTRTPFDASEYQVVLHAEWRYAPTLHPRDNEHTYSRADNILKTRSVSKDERVVLEALRTVGGYPRFRDTMGSAVDPSGFFRALAKTQFLVRAKDGENTRARSLTLDNTPVQLKLSVVQQRFDRGDGAPDSTRETLLLTLPDERQPHPYAARSRYMAYGDCVLHETDVHVHVYRVGPTLSGIIGRMQPLYSDGLSRTDFVAVGTELRYEDILYLRDLTTTDMSELELEGGELLNKLTIHDTTPTRLMEVFLDLRDYTLRIRPCAAYGPWYSDVGESVQKSAHGRVRYKRRATFTHDGVHNITMHDDGLHLAVLNDKVEIALYRELEAYAETLGFTKTLKCVRRGKGPVERYLLNEWPALRAFAQKKGYEIVYTQDALPDEQVTFTADFTSDINTEKDWLHFDVDLYCAGDRVSLDELYTFIESGETYWRKKDGSLVEVENRPELERLVRLLRSFRGSKDGGFEGKLHHAPELSYIMTSSPHYTAAQSKSLHDFMKRVESGKPIRAVRIPKKIKDIARPYQIQGIEWLHFLRSYHFAGILADDMGLGKTLQTLTVLSMTKHAGVPSLVVCPKSLLYNWQQEAATFFPRLKVLVYDGSQSERLALLKTLTEHDLVVVSYNTLKRDADYLCAPGRRYNYAVLDEAQYIKNYMTKMAQRVKEIPADYRLALTGTPLENHVFELWSIFDYLMPGFLGRRDHFNERFYKPIMDEGDTDALLHLRRKIEPFMLRRTKAEVLKDLPPKVEQTRECTLSDAQNILYQQVLLDVRGTIHKVVEEKGFKGSQIHILAGLTKLRQVCNHPALLTGDTPSLHDSAKLDACIEVIEEVRQGDRKVLVFSQFTGMLDILASALTEAGIGFTYLSGKTKKRQEVIERFNSDPQVTAFLVSMKAGGTGLNLTAADTVVVFDPWWNPSVENQAVDRAHRMGQTHSVNVYRLLTRGTIEEKMQELKRKKQGMFDAVVSETGDLLQKLTWEDIKELFAE